MTEQSQAITRKSASNLALAFILLPKDRRDAMAALYAFCREVDDVADDESVPTDKRRADLAMWREDVRLACTGGVPKLPVNQELQAIIVKYKLRFELFDDLIRGVEMDLDIKRYQTFADLEKYCYRVASVVGLLSVEIFGYTDPRCLEYAVHLGKALQLTNILRDVRVDGERGRIYLPLEVLEENGVTEKEVLDCVWSERFESAAQRVSTEARKYYLLARQSLPASDRRSMIAAELMGSVYWRLLRKVEKNRFQVLGPQMTRLSKGHKILLILRTWSRLLRGAAVPNYGFP